MQNMEEFVVEVEKDRCNVFVSSLEEAGKLIEEHEISSRTRFACYKKTKDFGNQDTVLKGHRLLWEDFANSKKEATDTSSTRIPYDGVPFMVLGTKILDCQHGIDKHVHSKKKRKDENNKDGDPNFKKRRLIVQDTKKFGCKAAIKLKEILKFPDFKDVRIENEALSNGLLLVYQKPWQQRLLTLYGNEFCLLDAAYKTTRYALPVFFLVVKTNVDYQVVGLFFVEEETTDAIKEALLKLRKWNPTWSPRFFMVDKCEEEFNAIESVFTDCKAYLCDFHREQAWERWVDLADHGVRNHREEILRILRKIARSASKNTYDEEVAGLKACDVWKQNETLRVWFENTWLKDSQRWVTAFRKETFNVIVTTNNGVERLKTELKHSYLKDYKDSSFSELLSVLVDRYLPDKYQSYIDGNTRSSGRFKKYSNEIPEFLNDRPRYFINHCLRKLKLPEDLSKDCIDAEKADEGLFSVKFPPSKEAYTVSFGNDEEMPKCSCQDWCSTFLPCVHFFAIMKEYPEWSWSKFPVKYKDSVFFCLDKEVIFGTPARNGRPDADDVCHQSQDRASACRELLRQIQSLTYEVHDEESLESLQSTLVEARESLHRAAPEENSLELDRNNIKTSRFFPSFPLPNSSEIADIPNRKSRKRPRTGRVDNSLVTNKTARDIVNDDCMDDIENYYIPSTLNNVVINSSNDDDDVNQFVEEKLSSPSTLRRSERQKRNLSSKKSKSKDNMLGDESINYAQKLLHTDFPELQGLEDTVVGFWEHYHVIEAGRYVQILYTGDEHWVCCSNIQVSNDNPKANINEVDYYDSLTSRGVTLKTKQQVAQFLHCAESELRIKVRQVKQQDDGVQCGLFAIAYATSLAFKQSPTTVNYDETKLEKHLSDCFEAKKMTPFPTLTEQWTNRCLEDIIIVELYCVCRMPWDENSKNKGDRMAECDSCKKWFHQKCQVIPDQVFSEEEQD